MPLHPHFLECSACRVTQAVRFADVAARGFNLRPAPVVGGALVI
jgi:hypothetical protein